LASSIATGISPISGHGRSSEMTGVRTIAPTIMHDAATATFKMSSARLSLGAFATVAALDRVTHQPLKRAGDECAPILRHRIAMRH
jgi:hypothetical protein